MAGWLTDGEGPVFGEAAFVRHRLHEPRALIFLLLPALEPGWGMPWG